ncbi:MAG: MASE1 domain-containing protein [Hyphomicrobiaceae bacterium]|nr:MASE1 domain-containing protein [Hyphomicrobiaceae bacterium]
MLHKAGEQLNEERSCGAEAHGWAAWLGLTAATGTLYLLAARLSLTLLTEPDGVAVFWPAAGVSAGALVALGPGARLPVVTGVVAATLAANLSGDRNFASAIVFALCNAAEAALTACFIERQFGTHFSLDSFGRVVGLLIAAALAAAVSGIGGTFGFVLFHGSAAPVLMTWYHWFASDALGIVTVAPLVIGLIRVVRDPPKAVELAEAAMALVALSAATIVGFALPTSHWATILPLALPLPLLFWLTARCRPVFASAAVFILALTVVWTVTFGVGRLGDPSIAIAERVLAGQTGLVAIAFSALALAALFAERRCQEATIAERSAHLALVEKTALVGNYAFDIAAARVQISPGCAAILGFPEGTTAILRDDWRAGVHPDDLRRCDAILSQAVAGRQREYHIEYRVLRSGGDVRWIEARAFVSYDRDGRAERVVGINIDVTERKRAEEQKSLLIAELDHRVKNVLANVAVVAKRTSERSISTDGFIDALEQRLQSMGEAHALLSRSRWQSVSLVDLVAQELGPYASAGNTIVEGPYVGLTAAATQAMAMVLHELATNAAKYGALSTPQGRVSVRWSVQSRADIPSAVRLQWNERGGPAVTQPSQTGYGTSVIRDLIAYELGGTVDHVLAPDGAHCTITFPAVHATFRYQTSSARQGLASVLST